MTIVKANYSLIHHFLIYIWRHFDLTDRIINRFRHPKVDSCTSPHVLMLSTRGRSNKRTDKIEMWSVE